MFELYNTCLRAWGNTERGIVPPYATVYAGAAVEGRFVTTLHVLNSGVLKLATVQPAMEVYRGISAMKLPESFTKLNQDGVRGGVEYGFMSTTTNKDVALAFAKDATKETASTLIIAKLGMIDRGASLDWLSQYPHEKEILMPPLTALEVLDITDFTDEGGFDIRTVTVRLNCNMISMTIEKLLSLRKAQVEELVEVVQKDLSRHDDAYDIPIRMQKIDRLGEQARETSQETFNDNANFSDSLAEVLDLMPKVGDEIILKDDHSGPVYGLVPSGDAGGFISTSWDGTARQWKLNPDLNYTSGDALKLPAASLCVAYTGPSQLASGQFDGNVATLSEMKVDEKLDTVGGDAIASVAWCEALGMLATGTVGGKLQLWSANKLITAVGGEAQSGLGDDGHTDTVRALVWVQESTSEWQLVSGSFDKTLKVWKATPDGLHIVRTVTTSAAVTAVVAAGDSSKVAIGSEDGSVSLFDPATKGEPELLMEHDTGVCSLAWLCKPLHADGPRGWLHEGLGDAWLACGLGDGSITINGQMTADGAKPYGPKVRVLRGHGGGAHALLWQQERGWLISGSADTTVRVWRVRADTQ